MLHTNCLAIFAATLAFGCSSVKAQKTDEETSGKSTPASAPAAKPTPAPTPAPSTKEAAKGDVPAATATAAPAAAPTLDPKLTKAAGEGNLKTIHAADKVTMVDVSSSKSEDPKAIQGHAPKGDVVVLSAEAVSKLKGFLLDKNSHRIGMRARCRFKPRHAFVFHQGEKTTSVLYASKGNCPKWSFPGTPSRTIIDVKKSVSKSMKALLKEIRGEKK